MHFAAKTAQNFGKVMGPPQAHPAAPRRTVEEERAGPPQMANLSREASARRPSATATRSMIAHGAKTEIARYTVIVTVFVCLCASKSTVIACVVTYIRRLTKER